MTDRPALERWRSELGDWAIPEHISEQAPAFPWRLDPELFRPLPGSDVESRSTAIAFDGLPDGGSVLDIGCGGGAASLALAERAGSVVGVDESAEMLELFSEEALFRGLDVRAINGRWPEVVTELDGASFDVIVCHHVAYNVADLDRFALALDASVRPRGRVVIELTSRHPQTVNGPLWEHFWNLDRPGGPSANDAHAVIIEAGIDATLEFGEAGRLRRDPPWDTRVAGATRMLCLGLDRSDEVAEQLRLLPERSSERAIIWWDRPAQA